MPEGVEAILARTLAVLARTLPGQPAQGLVVDAHLSLEHSPQVDSFEIERLPDGTLRVEIVARPPLFATFLRLMSGVAYSGGLCYQRVPSPSGLHYSVATWSEGPHPELAGKFDVLLRTPTGLVDPVSTGNRQDGS